MEGSTRMIDVVIPVYRGYEQTLQCVTSVLQAQCRSAFDVVVVDDASPEPALREWLAELASGGRIQLISNEVNRGFVASVNRAIALHPDRDVILLNSDTEVADGWVDRIARCAAMRPDVGTVTPFSNNATICSYPYEGWTGELPGSLGLGGLDRLIADTLAGVAIDLPTGIGFCLYVRRACLDQVGAFDEAAFGRGYGEENDLCMRIEQAGWRNVLCADVFVYHHGGVSFGAEREALMARAREILLARHPDYEQRVHRFLAQDPLHPLRVAIDRARVAVSADEAAAVDAEQAVRPARWRPVVRAGSAARYIGMRADDVGSGLPAGIAQRRRPVVLHIAHSWGGGVERWIDDFTAADPHSWHLLLRSRSWRNQAGVRLELIDRASAGEALLAWDLEPPIDFCDIEHAQYREILAAIVESFRVTAVVVSSLIGHALEVFGSRLPTVVVLHDLFPFCPALFAWFGEECADCPAQRLDRCSDHNPLNVFWHHKGAERWMALRSAYAERLAGAQVSIVAPSRSVHERYAKLLPVLRDKPWHLVPHGLAPVPVALLPRAALEESGMRQRLRVLVPGRLSPHKGLHLLREILPRVAAFADVMLLGSGDFGAPFAHLEHVIVVPEYSVAQLPAHVGAFGPDCALLLSTLPETFSYTLSEMQALGVPVVATAMGAFVERIEDGKTGFLVAPDVEAIVSRLEDLAARRDLLMQVAVNQRLLVPATAERMAARYRELLRPAHEQVVEPPALMGMLTAVIADSRERECSTRAELEQARSVAGAAEARAGAAEVRAEVAEAHIRAAEAHVRVMEAELACREEAHRAALETLGHRAEQAEARNVALLESTSWRVTAPLRALAIALKPVDERPQEMPTERSEEEAEPAAAAEPDAAPSALRVVAVHVGDAVMDRRARRLARSFGLSLAFPEPGAPRALESPLPVAGVDLAMLEGECLRVVSDSPDPPFALCLESDAAKFPPLAAQAGKAAGRLIVPSRTVANALSHGATAAGLDLRVADFPLAGDWGGEWASPCAQQGDALRSVLRSQRRDALGLPDRSRIVVGIGRADAHNGLLAFAQAATSFASCHNDSFFVWIGPQDPVWVRAHREELSLPTAMRRLFMIDDAVFEPWLLAADVYYGCRAATSYDDGAIEALACALPVVLDCCASVPDGLFGDDAATGGGVSLGAVALPRVLSGDCGAPAARFDLAQRTRARFGADTTMAAFAAALGVSGAETARTDLSE